jgi:cation-transporting ATPase E
MDYNRIRRKGFVRTRDNIPVKYADPEKGLTAEQVELRRACGWSNTPPAGAGRTEQDIVKAHTLTVFNLVFLVLAAALLLVRSDPKNLVFLIVVVCNTVIGIVQELRSKRLVDKLTLIADQRVPTVREGNLETLTPEQLVRDDIVELSAGDHICADAMIRTGELQVNESLITGESTAVLKRPGDELKSGTFVLAGRARVQLTGVGSDAMVARLTAQVREDPGLRKSEMMSALDRLIRIIGYLLVPVGILLFCLAYFRQELELRESAERAVAALVGMIPEGLYLLTSIVLALSGGRLSRRRVLVQNVNCIETAARADVLCVDKTGTITAPEVQVEHIVPLTEDPPERLEAIFTALYGSNPAENETDQALAELFSRASDWECLRRIPFTAAGRWNGGVFKDEGAFIVGAPEAIMDSRWEELREQVEQWTAKGYRVALAAQYHGEPEQGGLEDYRVVPLALVVLSSRIKSDAVETFRELTGQGITVKVLSGDNVATASEVARRSGIENAERCIDCSKLSTEADFSAAVEEYTVFGRVSPEQKRLLIQAMQQQGHTVVMVGDGVNDVPAMKTADCAIAMASGASAACQAADFVLLNSDLSALLPIVEEGRHVVGNVQRAAGLFLAKNIFSLGLALLCLLTLWTYPLSPVQMILVSTLTIGLPSLLLTADRTAVPYAGQFLTRVLRNALPGGLTGIALVLLAQSFGYVFGLEEAAVSTVCVVLSGWVGLLVLYDACKPVAGFRRSVFWLAALSLLGCFTLLGSFFELTVPNGQTVLILAALLLSAPTVYHAIDWLTNTADRYLPENQ